MRVPNWKPPAELSREEIIKASEEILAFPDIPFTVREDIFRIQAVGMDWDTACEVFEPVDPSKIPVGADGKKVGLLLLHGGLSDHRFMRPVAELMTGKFGCKVVSLSFPGRLYLNNDSHDWPGDTMNPDGSVRVPHWCRNQEITPDQYEVISDRSRPEIRKKRGTVYMVKGKEGSEFYYRMAGWPVAHEVGGVEACRRNLPEGEYTIYGHGRSTGGPMINMLSQRIPNYGGQGGMENSAFGSIPTGGGHDWPYPFYCLTIRTWRDIAKYKGPEHGLEGAMRLPMLMEEIFEQWDRDKVFAGFKAEAMISWGMVNTLAEAAKATAKRLILSEEETAALIKHYQGYTREMSGPGTRPVPPLLLGIAANSVDHKLSRYHEVVLPAHAAMNPPPKVHLTFYHAGTHRYMAPEPGMPLGCGPAMAKLWTEAIENGFYVT